MTSRSTAPSRARSALERLPTFGPMVGLGPRIAQQVVGIADRVRTGAAAAGSAPLDVRSPASLAHSVVGQLRGSQSVPQREFNYQPAPQYGTEVLGPPTRAEWENTGQAALDAQRRVFDEWISQFHQQGEAAQEEYRRTVEQLEQQRVRIQEDHDFTVEEIGIARRRAGEDLRSALARMGLDEDEIRARLRQFEEQTELQLAQLQENFDMSMARLYLEEDALVAAYQAATQARERGALSEEEMQRIYGMLRERAAQVWAQAEQAQVDTTALEESQVRAQAELGQVYDAAEQQALGPFPDMLTAEAQAAVADIVQAGRSGNEAVLSALSQADLNALRNEAQVLAAAARSQGAGAEFGLHAGQTISAADQQVRDEALARQIAGLELEQQALGLSAEELQLAANQARESAALDLAQAREDTDLALRGVALNRAEAQQRYNRALEDLYRAETEQNMWLRRAMEDLAGREFESADDMRRAIASVAGDRDEVATELAMGVAVSYLDPFLQGLDPIRRTHLQSLLIAELGNGTTTSAAMQQVIRDNYQVDPESGDWVAADGSSLTQGEVSALVGAAGAYASSWQSAYDLFDAQMAGSFNTNVTGSVRRGSSNWANRNEPEYRQRASLAKEFGKHILSVFPNARSAGQYRDISQASGPGRARDSDHLSGGAIDIRANTHEEMLEIARYARQYLGDAVAYVVYEGDPYHEGDHVHISFNLGVGHFHDDGSWHGPTTTGGGSVVENRNAQPRGPGGVRVQ